MSKISEAAKLKARKLLSAQFIDNEDGVAAFIQRVSDAAKLVRTNNGDAYCIDGNTVGTTLAPFILPDPVDPLLIEAREIVENYEPIPHASRTNPLDHTAEVQIALAALKRGMELAGKQTGEPS